MMGPLASQADSRQQVAPSDRRSPEGESSAATLASEPSDELSNFRDDPESQVAQKTRLEDPKVAHSSWKVAHFYRQLAVKSFSLGADGLEV